MHYTYDHDDYEANRLYVYNQERYTRNGTAIVPYALYRDFRRFTRLRRHSYFAKHPHALYRYAGMDYKEGKGRICNWSAGKHESVCVQPKVVPLPAPQVAGLLPARVPLRVKLLPDLDGHWLPIQDGDRRALALYNRHYSAHGYRGSRERKLFMGVGEKIVLMTAHCDALFGWRYSPYSAETGIECNIFRNESEVLSSVLITEAMTYAFKKWGDNIRLFTYVRTDAIKSNNPGYCFKCAGWIAAGYSKKGLLILEYQKPKQAITYIPAPGNDHLPPPAGYYPVEIGA